MAILLDTHTFIWHSSDDQRLPHAMALQIKNQSNQIWISMATVWEMAIKIGTGKLSLDIPLEDLVAQVSTKNRFGILPIQSSHVFELKNLPTHHKDPFDRMLAAQCWSEGFTIFSRDLAFDELGVQRIWNYKSLRRSQFVRLFHHIAGPGGIVEGSPG